MKISSEIAIKKKVRGFQFPHNDAQIFLKTSKSKGFTVLIMRNISECDRREYQIEAANGIPAQFTFGGFIHKILDSTSIWPILCDLLIDDPFMCVCKPNLKFCIPLAIFVLYSPNVRTFPRLLRNFSYVEYLLLIVH